MPDAITITRLLPADLWEARQVFPDITDIDELLATLQEGLAESPPIARTFDCPKCVVVPPEGDPYVNSGWIDVDIPEAQGGGTARVICNVCFGYQKTAVAMEAYESETGYRPVEE